MAIVDLEVATIQELITEVLKIRDKLADDAFLWFRGQSCDTYRLLPKIRRDGKPDEQVLERERRLLTRFRQRSMAYWPSGYPQTDWEHLFAMQHYGIPTRLLDWSENLFVAAYFALSSVDLHPHPTCVPVLWCVDPVLWNRSTPSLADFGDSIRVLTTADEDLDGYLPDPERRPGKFPVTIFGSHNSDRIVAQRGTFMVWGTEGRALEEISATHSGETLWRILLKGDRATLFRHLQVLGFSETMVFPELPYLATELTRTEGWRK